MVLKKKKYQRLPGKKKSFLIGFYTLWQGVDHLLLVYSRFGVEDYKRFYFSDIQSIITYKTVFGKIQNLIIGLFLVIFGVFVIALDGAGAIFGGIMAGCMIIFLSINWLRGPTCITHLQTAVQTEKLHPLCRLKHAQKVMDRLWPLIEQVQGHLTPETLNLKILYDSKTAPAMFYATSTERNTKTIRNESGIAHLTLFSLMLCEGLMVLLNAYFRLTAFTLLSTFASMGIGICVIVALVKQRNSNIPRSLRNMTWTGLGYVGISFLLGYIFTIVLVFKNPEIMDNQWKLIERVAGMSFFENPFIGSLNILSLCGAFCLAIPGLVLMDKHRKSLTRPTVEASVSQSKSLPTGNQ